MAHKPCITVRFVTVCCSMSVVSKTSCSQAGLLSYMLKNCSHFSGQGSYYGYTQTWTKLHTEVMNWISGASYECWLCMALTSSNLNDTVHNSYRLWVACPCLSWSTVGMRVLTWVVFTPSFFYADAAFWQYSRAGHETIRPKTWQSS